MLSGNRALLLYMIHLSILVIAVSVSVILGPVFGMDSVDEYSIMYMSGSYTLLAYVYGIIMLVFIVLAVFLSPLNALPYAVMFWLNWNRNKSGSSGIRRRGIILTAAMVTLIAIHPFTTIHMTGLTIGAGENWNFAFWAIVFLILFLTAYVIPFLFLSLIYSGLKQLKFYQMYRKCLIVQYAVCCLLVLYWNTTLPGMLRHFIDSRFLY